MKRETKNERERERARQDNKIKIYRDTLMEVQTYVRFRGQRGRQSVITITKHKTGR